MQLRGRPMGFVSSNSRDFWKMCHWTNFANIPYIERFFRLFSSFYAKLCNKIFNFHKIRWFFTKIPKFLKIFRACGGKNVSLNPIFPKKFPKVTIFRRLRRRKMCHWTPKLALLLAVGSPQLHPWYQCHKVSFIVFERTCWIQFLLP